MFFEILDVCLMAAVAALGLVAVGWLVSTSKQKAFSLRRFHKEEGGGAYTFNYLLAIFCIFLFTCVVVECAQMFLAKTGTVYAAFAGARTSIVHVNDGKQEELAERSARRAFVPFARGLEDFDSESFESESSSDLWESYSEVAEEKVVQKYFLTKEKSAASRIRLQVIDDNPSEWNSNLKVQVTYRYPLMFPFLGVVLGKSEEGEYFREFKSVVTLPKESPQNELQELGISYAGN